MSKISVCPFCDSPRVHYRSGGRGSNVTTSYHCVSCKQRFKKPLKRQAMTPGSRRGLSKKLCELDPDEVTG